MPAGRRQKIPAMKKQQRANRGDNAPASLNGSGASSEGQLSELEHLKASYRSTRIRIGRGRRLCVLLVFLSLAFFITLTGLILCCNPTGKTYFLNTSFVLTVVSLACVVMLLIGLTSLAFWFYLTRLRIRLENNYTNLELHFVLATEHLNRERAVLARELQGYTSVPDTIVQRAAEQLQEHGKCKGSLLNRCDALHLMMDEALRWNIMNIKPDETE